MHSSFRDQLTLSLEKQLLRYPNMVVLYADSAKALRFSALKDQYPQRFFCFGISEADMTSAAAGMASCGLLPVIVGFSMFVAERPFEQIRQSLAYPQLNAKIIATHAGICVGEDGATHQAIEDIAVMRALPHMQVLTAADAAQADAAVTAMLSSSGLAYLRLGRDEAAQVYTEQSPYQIGGSDTLREGKDVSLVAHGLMVHETLKAAVLLEQEGIAAEVINAYSIKPLDENAILTAAQKTGCIVTAEDHMEIGGLGSAVAECLVKHYPVPMEMVAVQDTFGESGSQAQLYEKFGLNAAQIASKARSVIRRKKSWKIG